MSSPTSIAFGANVNYPFLEGLSPHEVKAVLAAATRRRFPARAIIFHQDMPADHFFLLMKGRARFFINTPDGKKIILLWLPEGEAFGNRALEVQRAEYLVSTETVRESTVLIWERPTIRRLAIRSPRLFENALGLATEYLGFYVATHVALTCHTASRRLAAVLLNLARGIGRPLENAIELDVTNEELAQAASVTHFTASRLLSNWQRRGAVIKQRGKVLLLSPERLSP